MLSSISDVEDWLHRKAGAFCFCGLTDAMLSVSAARHLNLSYICVEDIYDGKRPEYFAPKLLNLDTLCPPETLLDASTAYLLQASESREFLSGMAPGSKLIFFNYDERVVAIADELGFTPAMPDLSLKHLLDSKLASSWIARQLELPTPRTRLMHIRGAHECTEQLQAFGGAMVVQAPYGAGGHGTFIIRNLEDWKEACKTLPVGHPLKVMELVTCREAAVDACATPHGTLVGPLTSEIIGQKELTHSPSGWSGNLLSRDDFTKDQRNIARDYVRRIGALLTSLGYRGCFGVDFLIDMESGTVLVGEINARVTGASALSNAHTRKKTGIDPLMLHMLEYSEAEIGIDLDACSEAACEVTSEDEASTVILRHLGMQSVALSEPPKTGLYSVSDGKLMEVKGEVSPDMPAVGGTFGFLRSYGPGRRVEPGWPLGQIWFPIACLNQRRELGKTTRQAVDILRLAFGAPVENSVAVACETPDLSLSGPNASPN